ncbi:tetratricopeptide repeat protein [Nannocystis pusilla]|uniref:tetratricopeptide repeat protein n=1 Tax=Nannocystis pusilla TaxID=889268 RepID=UPI003B7AEDA6
MTPVLASPEVEAYPPLEAEARLSLGVVELTALRFGSAAEALRQAEESSLRAGHLAVAAEAFARRIYVQGQSGAAKEAIQDVPLARALVDWSGDDHLRWLLLNNTGMAYYSLGRAAEAQEHILAALQIKEKLGDLDFEYAATLSNLGLVELALGDLRAAREYLVRSLESDEGALGAAHPRVVLSRIGLALVELYAGRFDASLGGLRAAVAAMVRIHGPTSDALLNTYLQLAGLSNRRGAHADALEYADHAAAVRAAQAVERDPILVMLYIHRAVALAGLGRHEEAAAELRAGLEFVATGPRPASDAALLHDASGRIALERGDVGEASHALARARRPRGRAGHRAVPARDRRHSARHRPARRGRPRRRRRPGHARAGALPRHAAATSRPHARRAPARGRRRPARRRARRRGAGAPRGRPS